MFLGIKKVKPFELNCHNIPCCDNKSCLAVGEPGLITSRSTIGSLRWATASMICCTDISLISLYGGLLVRISAIRMPKLYTSPSKRTCPIWSMFTIEGDRYSGAVHKRPVKVNYKAYIQSYHWPARLVIAYIQSYHWPSRLSVKRSNTLGINFFNVQLVETEFDYRTILASVSYTLVRNPPFLLILLFH